MSKPLVGLEDESGPRTKTVTYSTVLGRGAYATVYRAKCGELPCAAKILYSIFTQDPAVNALIEKFYQECDYLKNIKHPNVVQYLGVCREPETQQPVLLMEMMDQSLTHFLESSDTPLPRRVEFSICHDVALALEYLHSMNIVHRDLSSNNVLLIGPGSRAKVSDFGMSRVIDNSKNNYTTPLTTVPGTVAYMPYEALGANPKYTEKIDVFSFGVLAIQIMTRQFPNPTDRFQEIEDPRSPVGTATVPVPEIECRKEHIDMISKSHPLFDIALDCLSLKMDDRPSAKDLCHRVEDLKKDLPAEIPVIVSELGNSVESIQLLKERVASLEQELKKKANSEACARCAELELKLKAIADSTEKQPPYSGPGNVLSLSKWKSGSPAPSSVASAPTTMVYSSMFTSIDGKIFEYNVKDDKWVVFSKQIIRRDRLPSRALTFFHKLGSLVVLAGAEAYIMQEGKWNVLKSFLTSSRVGVLSYENHLIFLTSSEAVVYQCTINTVQLVGSFQIPKLRSPPSAQICNGTLYFICTHEKDPNLSRVCKISLRKILQEPSTTWFISTLKNVNCTFIAPLQVTRSTLVSYNDNLLSVGGCKDNNACRDILLYEEESNNWVLVGSLPTPRYNCLAEVVGNQLVVVGGWLNHVISYDLVEIATLS